MFKVISVVASVVALAGIVSGCGISDQGKLYSQSAKPRATQAASVTPDAARSSKISEPQRSTKISEPQIVLGAAY